MKKKKENQRLKAESKATNKKHNKKIRELKLLVKSTCITVHFLSKAFGCCYQLKSPHFKMYIQCLHRVNYETLE